MRPLIGFVLVSVSLGAEPRPAPEGAWVPLVHGMEARLRAKQASFDSAEKIEIVVDVRNSGQAETYLDTFYVVQLRLYQDGKEVRPELTRLFGPTHRTPFSPEVRWLEPGKSFWLPATFEHGAFNLFSAYAAFSLSPGKYEMHGSLRLRAGLRTVDRSVREGVIDLKPIAIEVTGKPLPPWPRLGGGKPLEGLEVPEATRKLSARLRALSPRDAVAALLEEHRKAHSALQGMRFETEDDRYRFSEPWLRFSFSAGTGWLAEGGKAADELQPVRWLDVAKKTEVQHLFKETKIIRHDKPDVRPINPGYDRNEAVFPMELIEQHQSGENWLCRRDGDLLVLACYGDQTLVWIDLRSLAVLSNAYHYKYDRPSCSVTRLEGHRYLEAFPFPVPRREVTEYYTPVDQKEPGQVYVRTVRSVELRKSPLPELRLPPIPKQ
jgi:hypothetical protein